MFSWTMTIGHTADIRVAVERPLACGEPTVDASRARGVLGVDLHQRRRHHLQVEIGVGVPSKRHHRGAHRLPRAHIEDGALVRRAKLTSSIGGRDAQELFADRQVIGEIEVRRPGQGVIGLSGIGDAYRH